MSGQVKARTEAFDVVRSALGELGRAVSSAYIEPQTAIRVVGDSVKEHSAKLQVRQVMIESALRDALGSLHTCEAQVFRYEEGNVIRPDCSRYAEAVRRHETQLQILEGELGRCRAVSQRVDSAEQSFLQAAETPMRTATETAERARTALLQAIRDVERYEGVQLVSPRPFASGERLKAHSVEAPEQAGGPERVR